MSRILIVAPAWVGDTVLMQPLVERLRAHAPGPSIDVLAPAWTLPLLARMPGVAESIESPFRHGDLRLRERRRLGRLISERGYDQAIVLPNSWKSALVPFFAGIPRRTGYRGEARFGILTDARRLDETALPLMVERFAALADRPGTPLARPVPAPRLRADPRNRDRLLGRLGLPAGKPVTVLCPGAEYGPAKRWPAELFADLARRLAQAGHSVWLVGSPRDASIGAEIALGSCNAATNLCGRTGLDDAIDLLSCADQVVTNDSGLMHVAAALDRPMVALFGSSSPQFTPPLSDKARILSLGLECSPCFRRECPLGHFRCMKELGVERVLAAFA